MTVAKKLSEKIQDEHTDDPLAEIDLTGAPALRPLATLRMGQRKWILKLADSFNGIDQADFGAILDVLDEIDQALEQVAVDKDAYAAWAVGDDLEQRIGALFMRYAAPLGDSKRSAN